MTRPSSNMAAPIQSLVVKWSGKEYNISGLTDGSTVLDLKNGIQKETGVLPQRQKLLGLKLKGKVPDDDVPLSAIKINANTKIMMMGTREDVLQDIVEPPKDIPEVLNDFDIEEEVILIQNREEYLAKVERRISDYKIDIINEPRDGKKLLVLDIDYTLFDHRSVGESGLQLMRPFLHEFLSSSYEDYDIVIWSATSMKWIKAKMEELGVLQNTHYKLCFMVDSLAMITVDTPNYGVIEVKPLGVLWGKFPQWSAANTIMFDDLRRNFIMNPQSGLKIRPFKEAHFNRDKDRELLHLMKYLKDISRLDDFSTLNHNRWEKYRPPKGEKRKSKDTQNNQPSGTS